MSAPQKPLHQWKNKTAIHLKNLEWRFRGLSGRGQRQWEEHRLYFCSQEWEMPLEMDSKKGLTLVSTLLCLKSDGGDDWNNCSKVHNKGHGRIRALQFVCMLKSQCPAVWMSVVKCWDKSAICVCVCEPFWTLAVCCLSRWSAVSIGLMTLSSTVTLR